jgi:hypothetical protein
VNLQEWLERLPGQCVLFEQRPVAGLGRNGEFMAIGLYADNVGDRITITPFNRRGNLARCRIEVPIGQLAEFISVIKSLVAKSRGAVGHRSSGGRYRVWHRR